MGDLILGVILLLGLFYGWRQGVVKILGGVGAVIGGIFVARRITPHIMPWLETLVNGGTVPDNAGSAVFTTLFFSQTQFGRIIEIIIFIIAVAVVVWLLRKLANLLGNVVNHTPLVGFVSRVLGAVLALVAFVVIIYACYAWLIPWLGSLFPIVLRLETLLASSVYLLPHIQTVGFWAWDTAAYALDVWEQSLPTA